MYKKFVPVNLDTFNDNTWIGLSPITPNDKTESLEELEYTVSSHLSKHVISHARLCLEKEHAKEMTFSNAKAALEAVSNLFFQDEWL
jgi:hypothetical protein